MTDLVYRTVMHDLKNKINGGQFPDKKLPDERSLSDHYHVSRSSIKRALSVLVDQGIIFKKRGSGTFINPLYMKNKTIFHYDGSNLGITDSLKNKGMTPKIKLLSFKVIPTTEALKQDLFLKDDDFVYEIKRLRLFQDKPFMIETGYIPIRVTPTLSKEIVSGSIFNYLEKTIHKTVTRSFMSIKAAPSNSEDQKRLNLKMNEPVGVMEGIFFLDDGTPFEVSNMRLHYKYMKYNTFVMIGK
ncbi:GntR family transcriptional regulator [Philodulcilactobacillus myokoensis]|uniref:GntR family transcriptional regulator n=1 Tax=Philodulcilactobacillus myokoensis TaxID=2929573 RepID=A0A9W6B1V5_9LACO|nr:GntR family transcriptional regulator [Philodulcilactobacillus myokoensis]GLB47365.1 GntR family transcriptional regulator [Philodulcilactobacillus myokoensis]